MSTRCQIGIYPVQATPAAEFEALIYRHWDGYPENVLPDIMLFLKEFKQNRGLDDSEYLAARLVQHLCNLTDGGVPNTTGYGISPQFHGDIAFFYKIYPDAVEVYECTDEDPDAWKLLKTVPIE